MVEFLGDPLAALPSGAKPETVLWSSRGRFSYVDTGKVPDDLPGHWRAEFDFVVEGGHDPVEMRLNKRPTSCRCYFGETGETFDRERCRRSATAGKGSVHTIPELSCRASLPNRGKKNSLCSAWNEVPFSSEPLPERLQSLEIGELFGALIFQANAI